MLLQNGEKLTENRQIKNIHLHDTEKNTSLDIKVIETCKPLYNLHIWPCAYVLAKFVWSKRNYVNGKNIIEIGAGTALPGIVAAKCNAKIVFLTDGNRSGLETWLTDCQESCSINNVSKNTIIHELQWGDFNPFLFSLPKIDIVLGSDCFYQTTDYEDIIATVYYFLEKNPECVFWTSYQIRRPNTKLAVLFDKWNLTGSLIGLETFGGDTLDRQGHEIQMYEVRLKKENDVQINIGL